MADRGGAVPPPPAWFLVGCVDSGAHRTLLPLSFATNLGLDPAELTQDVGTSGGVGSAFNTWSSTIPIIGKVAAFPPGSTGPHPWGPNIAMNPAFTDLQPEPSPLIGRADFFRAFDILFEEDATDCKFTITER